MARQRQTERVCLPNRWCPVDDRDLVSEINSHKQKPRALDTANNNTHSYTWANEICADDSEERALVVSSMNGFQYAVSTSMRIERRFREVD